MTYRNQNYMTNILIHNEVAKNQKKSKKNYILSFFTNNQNLQERCYGLLHTTGESYKDLIQIKIDTLSTKSSLDQYVYWINKSAENNLKEPYKLYKSKKKANSPFYLSFDIDITNGLEPKSCLGTFYSDSEGESEEASGTIDITGEVLNGYIQIKGRDDIQDQRFDGKILYIIPNFEIDGETIYQLYEDDGNTSYNFYIKLSE